MSRVPWKGTLVLRPSGCRYCLCDPRCRASTKPNFCKIAATSRGLRTGSCPSSGNLHRLHADEFGLELRLAIFEQHLDHFLHITLQLVERLRLAMGPPES